METYKALNLKKIQEKESSIVPTEKALEDIKQIQWDDEVVKGNKKVLLIAKKNNFQENQ